MRVLALRLPKGRRPRTFGILAVVRNILCLIEGGWGKNKGKGEKGRKEKGKRKKDEEARVVGEGKLTKEVRKEERKGGGKGRADPYL